MFRILYPKVITLLYHYNWQFLLSPSSAIVSLQAVATRHDLIGWDSVADYFSFWEYCTTPSILTILKKDRKDYKKEAALYQHMMNTFFRAFPTIFNTWHVCKSKYFFCIIEKKMATHWSLVNIQCATKNWTVSICGNCWFYKIYMMLPFGTCFKTQKYLKVEKLLPLVPLWDFIISESQTWMTH